MSLSRPLSSLNTELVLIRSEEYQKHHMPSIRKRLVDVENAICSSEEGAERKRGERDALMWIINREKEIARIVDSKH